MKYRVLSFVGGLVFASVGMGQAPPQHSPRVITRAAQPYVAIFESVKMKDMGGVYPRLLPKVLDWLKQHHVQPAGPPFIRFLKVDMAKSLQIELGMPVAKAVRGSGNVKPGVIPAGKYVSLMWGGPDTVAGNAALQKWAKEQQLKFSRMGDVWTSRVEFSLTDPAKEPDSKKWQTEILYLLQAKR